MRDELAEALWISGTQTTPLPRPFQATERFSNIIMMASGPATERRQQASIPWPSVCPKGHPLDATTCVAGDRCPPGCGRRCNYCGDPKKAMLIENKPGSEAECLPARPDRAPHMPSAKCPDCDFWEICQACATRFDEERRCSCSAGRTLRWGCALGLLPLSLPLSCCWSGCFKSSAQWREKEKASLIGDAPDCLICFCPCGCFEVNRMGGAVPYPPEWVASPPGCFALLRHHMDRIGGCLVWGAGRACVCTEAVCNSVKFGRTGGFK